MDEAFVKKIQPHSVEAEQSVIGAMIMDRDAIVEVADMLTKEDFYHGQYGTLFEAMVELYSEGKAVDLVTLQNKLKGKDVPESICTVSYLSELVSAVPTSVNAGQYAKIIKDNAMLRALIKECEEIANDCYMAKEDVDTILEKTEKNVFRLLQKQKGADDYVPISEVVINTLEMIEAAAKNKGKITGLATGFIDLDMKLTGLHGSELIIVAARPAMGKTAFALNIAQHVAFKQDTACLIFNLEMSKEQLATRLLAIDSMVDSQNLRTGELGDMDWDKLMESAGTLGRSKLIIDDSSDLTISTLRSKCRKYKQSHDVGLIIIDYLQLLSGSGKRTESRQQEISEISRSLKSLARELNVPIIALSQLSRGVEARPDKRPMMSDLRESGAIEQDADVIMFLYRDDYYNPDTDKKGISEVIISKQRSGSTGTIELVWLGQYTKFANKVGASVKNTPID